MLREVLIKSTERLTWEITLHVAQIVNTEQRQHYNPRNIGRFG
jgi:hypothetical protein